MSWRYAARKRSLALPSGTNDRQIAWRMVAPPQGRGGVYSLYMTRRTEDVSCVLRDELAVAAQISTYPRERVLSTGDLDRLLVERLLRIG
jgi:hypothetical protein